MHRASYALLWACLTLTIAVAGTLEAAGRVRVQVRQSGLYRVAATDIAASLNLSTVEVFSRISASGLHLTSQGQDIPWFASEDGSNLCFYGEAFQSIYTDVNVYWIEDGVGTPMPVREAAAESVAPAGRTFADSAHFEDNQFYGGGILREPLQDFWLWSSMKMGGSTRLSLTFTARVDNVSSVANSTLNIRLVSTPDTTNSPDHHVYVYLNGTNVGESAWDGLGRHDLSLSCAPGLLVSGTNIVRVEGAKPPGVLASIVAMDSFDLFYRRNYVAVSNRLTFGSEAYEEVTVAGFGVTNMFVLDVTEPKHPVRLTGFLVETAAPPYNVSITPGGSNRWLYACAQTAFEVPVSVEGRGAVSLRAETNAADYLVIAPTLLWTEASEWAAYRQSQGLGVAMASLSDIYDEFNHGLSDPAAIRDFLNWVFRKWARVPRYVLLVGNGTFDFRNYKGKGDNLVPPLLIDVGAELGGLMGTDFFFGDVDGDEAPEFAVGRLPVTNGVMLRGLLKKVRQYERPENRTNAVLFVADYPVEMFHSAADCIAARVPQGEMVVKAYRASSNDNIGVKDRMMATLNGGCRVFTFVGHGATDRFGVDEPLLMEPGARALTNRECPPFVVGACCGSSQFDRPNTDSFCESMVLNTNGGAVATWAAINVTYNSENVLLADLLHQALYELGVGRYGDAVGYAQVNYAAAARPFDTGRQYNLLGDPATAFGDTNGLPATNPFGDAGPIGYDEWCRLQFSALERSRGLADSGADPDGDGSDNRSEFAAGSDALNAASLLRLSGIAAGVWIDGHSNAVRLSWPSVAQKTYGIDYSTNLASGFQPYTNHVPAWPPLNVHTCIVDWADALFFRVTVE